MARKKRSSSNRHSSNKRRNMFAWRHVAGFFLIFSIVLGIYVAYLDTRVRESFEGRLWSIPSQVYARPLELYVGLELDPAEFEQELELIGFNRVNQLPAAPGQYRQWDGQHYELITREFQFGDGLQKSQSLRIDFNGKLVEGVFSLYEQTPLALVRMPPARIAGIYPLQAEDRTLIRLAEAPDQLILTLLAVEDRRFYEHHGIDPRAIARAMWTNLTSGDAVQGGSTLTQQLVKNLFLTTERSIWRKFNEAIMALLLEAHYDKSLILETYLNEIYLGQDGARAIHGFALASEFYFGKQLDQLSRDQIAMLVGLVKGASWYDPRRNPERAVQRRNQVLAQMAEQGVIKPDQLKTLQSRPLNVAAKVHKASNRYPAFIDLIKRQLHEDYHEEDLRSEGLRIFTTLDPLLQRAAERAVREVIPALEKNNPKSDQLQTAVILTAPQNGDILALLGDRDPLAAGFNRALDATRQMGSLIKPAVYLAALQQPQNYNLATMVDDSPLRLKERNGTIWEPKNYDNTNLDKVPLFRALRDSRNIPAVRVGLDIGLANIVTTLNNLGITREVPPYPSMMLGAFNLTPLEVTHMYQTLAGKGFRIPLRSIREVTTNQGELLSRYPIQLKQTLKSDAVYQVNYNLYQVTQAGTAKSLKESLPVKVAGKTGTTDDLRDSWFAGFADNRLAVVWVGRDDNQATGLTGSSGALRIWTRMMQLIPLDDLNLEMPADMQLVWIDENTGEISAEGCAGAVELPFYPDYMPQQRAPCSAPTLMQRIKSMFN